MNRTGAILGALLLSALAVCVLGAGSASALTAHECKEFKTPKEGTGKTYKDAKCSEESAEGKFETVPIAGELEGEATLTPTTAGNEVTAGEEAGTHAVFHFITGGIEVRITCTGFSIPGAKGKNVEEKGAMSVTGSGAGKKFTGCKIVASEKAAANCKVPETMQTVEMSVTTEGDTFTLKPKSGAEIITINFESQTGKTCPAAIVGPKTVTGFCKGVAASPTAIEFTSTSGSELKIGEIPAQFTAVGHLKRTGSEVPIGLETP